MFNSMGSSNPQDLGNGGTIDGNLVITGDLQVSGGGSLSFDEIIQGNSNITGTLTVGSDGSGSDVVFYSATAGDSFAWDASEEKLTITGTNGQTALDVADGNLVVADNVDIEGDIDVNGTTNLDAVDIDGNVQLDGTFTIGTDGSGYDVTFYSATAGDSLVWDASEEKLTITGTNGQTALDIADGNLVVADSVDIEGDIDVNGTANLDTVDIDGDVDISGSITNATWTGDVIASAYLDSDTAHLSGTQTFSGSKTFSANTIISSTNQLQFGDTGTYIHQSADGVLDLVSDTEIEINATTIDVNGAMEVSGVLTASDDLVVSDELRPYEIRADGTSGIRLANSQGGIVGYLGLRSSGNYGSGVKLEDDIGSVIFGSDSDYSAKYDSGSDALEIIEGITSASETVLFSLSSSTTEVNTATTNFNGTAINFESSSADSPVLTIKNTNAGDGSPRLYFNHASASPEDNDELGQIRWYGLNDAGTPVSDVYARIKVNQTDVSSGSEAGKMGFQLMKAGTETDILTLDADSRISLSNNDAGEQNTIFGKLACDSIESTGKWNVALGEQSAEALTTGDFNVAIGYQALHGCTTNSGNISIGYKAHNLALTTNESVAIGNLSGEHQTSGNQNTFVGGWSANELTTADKCVAVGYNAMAGVSSTPPTGDSNVGVGWFSLARIQSGGGNVAMGSNTLEDLTTGQQNLALGHFAMAQTVGASDCTALGYYAMGAGNVTASGTTAVGASACAEKIGGGTSTAVGFEAMRADLYGEHNTAVGYQALEDNTIGDGNTAVGARALQTMVADNNSGNNTAVGFEALMNTNYVSSSHPTQNIALGTYAGKTNTEGSENCFLGWNAAATNTTGSNNTIIGSQANVSASGATGQIAIGRDVDCTGDNKITVGIGANTATLDLDGSDTSWASASSDKRLKENIETSSAGLAFINDLNPVTYNWKKAKDVEPSMPQYNESEDPVLGHEYGEKLHGFIAQEVKEAIDNHTEIADGFKMWKMKDDGTQTVADGNLIPILVKAVQELSAKVTELEKKCNC